MRGLLLVPQGPALDLLLPRLAGRAAVRLEGRAPRWVRAAVDACRGGDPAWVWVVRCGRWGAPPSWDGVEAPAGALEILLPPANPLVRAARSVWPADTWPSARAFAVSEGTGAHGLPVQMRPADRPLALLTWVPREAGPPLAVG